MERQEIYQRINNAKEALKPKDSFAKSVDEPITEDAKRQYTREALRIYGVSTSTGSFALPADAEAIIEKVRTAKTKNTLRKRARAVRYVASILLQAALKATDEAQRAKNWVKVNKTVSDSRFEALTKLAQMMPADYGEGWKAIRRRKGKKSSLQRLPENWQELMASKSTGQYRIPMMVALMTGCRPAELEKGIKLKLVSNSLYVQITGAKVKETAGQKTREFRLAEHPVTTELMQILQSNGQSEITFKVEKGNSVSTHMRSVGQKLWPRRKESITVYTARHAMAADCKAAVENGASEDLVSQVLGHVVDKTATYYGTKSQSGKGSVVPSEVQVPRAVKHKQRERSKMRMMQGAIPLSKKSKNKFSL